MNHIRIMSVTYRLNKHCPDCGRRLSDKNKSGYCNKHRDRTGPNNAFWGKTHTDSTKAILKEKCKDATRKMWEDESYRSLVIEHMTGLTRSDEFKETQRNNALKQFTDDSQRRMRSDRMKETWKTGAITWSPHYSPNFSKEQLRFGEALKLALGDRGSLLETKNSIKVNDRWIMPDLIYKNVVIEYNGDFWHANPSTYKADDVMHHGILAKDIWEHDNERYTYLESLGYMIIKVWASEYKKDATKVISDVVQQITKLEQKEAI